MMPPKVSLKQVPKSYKPEAACLYVICHPAFFDDPNFLQKVLDGHAGIYIGRTSMKVGKRYSDHTATRNGKPRHLTGPFIKAHGYTYETCFRVLAEGTMEAMKTLEHVFRSKSNMGLNEKVGG
jgi:hypothetical protein